MPQTSRRFEQDVTPESGLPLKERLTAFRAHYLGKPLPESTKPASGRLGDILKPLLQIIRLVKPEREPVFMELVRELERGRLLDKADSLEAQILKVVWNLKGEVHRGILPVKRITDVLNEDRMEREKLTYHKVGRRLWSLGCTKGAPTTAPRLWFGMKRKSCKFLVHTVSPKRPKCPKHRRVRQRRHFLTDVFRTFRTFPRNILQNICPQRRMNPASQTFRTLRTFLPVPVGEKN